MEKYYTISIKQAPNFILLVVVFALGIGFILQGSFVGAILLALFIGMFFMKRRIVFDKQLGKTKDGTVFFGAHLTSWKDMPDIDFVSVLKVNRNARRYSTSVHMIVQDKTEDAVYQVNLVLKDVRKPKKLISTNLEKALQIGKELGDYLDVRVYDATTNEQVWIR